MYKRLIARLFFLFTLLLFTLPAAAQSEPILRLRPIDANTVAVELTNFEGVFGIEILIAFDPDLIIVEDALVAGNCPTDEFVVVNSADSIQGTLAYAVTQLTTAPCDGGTVGTFTARCRHAEGALIDAALRLENHIVANKSGLPIEHTVAHTALSCPQAPLSPELADTPMPIDGNGAASPISSTSTMTPDESASTTVATPSETPASQGGEDDLCPPAADASASPQCHQPRRPLILALILSIVLFIAAIAYIFWSRAKR